MLAIYDWLLVPLCAALVAPAFVLNFVYGRKMFALSGRLHDRLEHEVRIVERASGDEVREHYDGVARVRVKMSDWEALNVGLMELFVLALMVAALVRYCMYVPDVKAGDIAAVFRYVLMFVMALDRLPMLVQQYSRLRDIGGRMNMTLADGPPVAGGQRRRGGRG
jgi:hypothetical protein